MFLPISKQEMNERNWSEVDFILISGDAYVDHPSFGVAIISRVLEAFGYKVAILAQPNVKNPEEFKQFGKPKLGFLITAGNIDSMVNHYTASKRRRDKDYYTPGGVMGKRPDKATITYSKIVRDLFSDSAIIIGGVEASLRRLAHYDYIQNSLRRSILLDASADLAVYGMAEKTIVEIADYLATGMSVKDLTFVKGTVWKTKDKDSLPTSKVILPSYDDLLADKLNYAKSFIIQHRNNDFFTSKILVEPYKDIYVIQNKPSEPLSQEYLDWVYSLPYERTYHSSYKEHIPAIDEVRHSIVVNRGCYGSCSFCAITQHQGRIMQSRSKDSVVEEAIKITQDKLFKGYIHDIGGPTANFYDPACNKQLTKGACVGKECLHPVKCNNLKVSHDNYLDILRTVRSLDKVKKVFVRSGIRYDYLMYDKNDEFFHELVEHHISGQLKVAPEHVSNQVLKYMQKPNFELYESFVKKYERINKEHNKDQFLVPYLMSSHPGSTLKDAIMLAEYIKANNLYIEQVQDFYPTPSTLSTCMYYTKVDPRTLEPVYVADTKEEKAMQRALMQFKNPKNYQLVYDALVKANRKDLIGFGPKCLIRPNTPNQNAAHSNFSKKPLQNKIKL
jgi:uncharacterized radical SAM protein YgiQ